MEVSLDITLTGVVMLFFFLFLRAKVYQGDLFVPGTCRSVEGYFTHNDTATTGQATTESTPASSKNGTSVAGRVQRSVPDSEVRSEGRVGLMYDNVPPLVSYD